VVQHQSIGEKMLDEEKLRWEIGVVRESIRLDWTNLTLMGAYHLA